jgi:hypothetical protein
MTSTKKPTEIRAQLAELGISTDEFARWAHATPRSARRWLSGENPLPHGLELLLTAIHAYPALLPVIRARVAWKELEVQAKSAARNPDAWLTREAFRDVTREGADAA